MAHTDQTVIETVKLALAGKWEIPEFQREFVWKSQQVLDLLHSLYRRFPVGTVLIWNSAEEDEENSPLYVVDGQQRTTALCLLMGVKPYWWKEVQTWASFQKRFGFVFDVEERKFELAGSPVVRSNKSGKYVPVSEILKADPNSEEGKSHLAKLTALAKERGVRPDLDQFEIRERLSEVSRIRYERLLVVTIDNSLEEVVEIFKRLNARGTRVTQADIYLAKVAGRNVGWVNREFRSYLLELKKSGFDLEPNLLFRCLTGIAAGKVRFRDIDSGFWSSDELLDSWSRLKKAFGVLIPTLASFGIYTNSVLPSENSLVSQVAMIDRFGEKLNRGQQLYWMIQASRFGRYSGPTETNLEQELTGVRSAETAEEAIASLVQRIRTEPVGSGDFLRDYSDGPFWKFFLYLLVCENKAQNWDEHGLPIGSPLQDGVMKSMKPNWHHVFPRKYLLDLGVSKDQINALGNIAVIGSGINIRISAKDPLSYIEKYKIDGKRLAQQFVYDDLRKVTDVPSYTCWLEERSRELADAANAFLAKIGPLSAPTSTETA